MTRRALLVVVALTASAGADDSWMAWQTLRDGQSDGIDVSFRPSTTRTCDRAKPFVAMHPRFNNRYTERIAGRLEIGYRSTQGARTETAVFELQPSETKIIETTSICHDTNHPLKLVVIELRFPDREAEQRRLAEQKAAADKAAAEKAAAQKAAAQKTTAELAAAEEARRKQLEERHRQAAMDARASDERTREAARAEETKRERERVAAIEAEEALARQAIEMNRATLQDLRRGEISFQLPTGFQHVEYGTAREEGLLFGARVEVRVFAWWGVTGTRAKPLGTGFEFAIAGSAATVSKAGQTRPSPAETTVVTAFSRARIWRGPVAIGLFGDWHRFSYEPGTGAAAETHSLFALGPEVALGIVASPKLGVELGARVGAAANTLDSLTIGATSDLYLAAYAIAAMNYLYGGAIATRYHDVSSGGVPVSWNAMALFGFRVPF